LFSGFGAFFWELGIWSDEKLEWIMIDDDDYDYGNWEG